MHDSRLSLANDTIDQDVYRQTYAFHGQTCNRYDSRLISHGSPTELSVSQISSMEFSEYVFGGVSHSFNLDNLNAGFRHKSADTFNRISGGLDLDVFEKFIAECFMDSSGVSAKRSYPSGGALYSGQVTIYVRGVEGIERGSYHVLPRSHKVEKLITMSDEIVEDRLFLTQSHKLHDYDFAILYSSLASIPLAKYRNRGYRLALLEAGSMYQLATHVSQNYGLSSRVWGGFDDDGLSTALGVDPRVAWPIVCQIFGRAQA